MWNPQGPIKNILPKLQLSVHPSHRKRREEFERCETYYDREFEAMLTVFFWLCQEHAHVHSSTSESGNYPLPTEELLMQWATHLASGMQHLFQLRFVHR